MVACHIWASSNASTAKSRYLEGDGTALGSTPSSLGLPGSEQSEDAEVSFLDSSALTVDQAQSWPEG